MKYLKLLLVPLVGLMFLTPVKAIDEVPFWAQGDYNYVVTESLYSGDLSVIVFNNISSAKMIEDNSKKVALWINENDIVHRLVLNTKTNTWVTEVSKTTKIYNAATYILSAYLDSNYGMSIFRYSSFDIKNGDNLVFQKTPVISLAMVQAKALEKLEAEVQGASGTILAVGGVILGALLAVQLVRRFRVWAMR